MIPANELFVFPLAQLLEQVATICAGLGTCQLIAGVGGVQGNKHMTLTKLKTPQARATLKKRRPMACRLQISTARLLAMTTNNMTLTRG